MHGFKLISWNVAHRKKTLKDQCRWIAGRTPQIVALQEVTKNTAVGLKDELANLGYSHLLDSFQLSPVVELTGPRAYGQLIASTFPVSSLPPDRFRVPWPECILSAEVTASVGPIEVHNVHIPPGSSNGWTKVKTLEGLYAGLARISQTPRVLCGDFNTPQFETTTGEVATWAQYVHNDGLLQTRRRFRKGSGPRWDKAERSILSGLAESDLPDVFRQLYGYSREEFSWYSHHQGKSVGRRFDHVFAGHVLNPKSFVYHHCVRENRLSDHSAVEVVFLPA